MAGILVGRRGGAAPGIAPDCTLLVRPIFAEPARRSVGAAARGVAGAAPTATPEELGVAIMECVEAGARLINLSATVTDPTAAGQAALDAALTYSARRGVVVVAAAGNQGSISSSVVTRHPWVIPVAACDALGLPLPYTNLGPSIGQRGLRAPGDAITSLGSEGRPLNLGGTSAAAPFVTGTLALLWSSFPNSSAVEVKMAATSASGLRRTTIVPPLLNAWRAYQVMRARS